MTKTATFHDLDGASVFITGGGSGIGAALTEGFAEQGAKVAFVDLIDASEFCAQVGKRTGNTPLGIQCDITDTKALQDAMAQAKNAHGPITALVNNAANDVRHLTKDVTEEFYNWMMDINLKSYFFSCQTVIPQMQEAGFGSIVNFSSISYMMGHPDYPLYTAANSAINGMSRSLARSFGPDRIRVNAVMPGWVITPRQQELWVTEESLASHVERQCLKDT
ncbi:unnamed protein product, partial [Ectocarpus sp. 12 AP-2014]